MDIGSGDMTTFLAIAVLVLLLMLLFAFLGDLLQYAVRIVVSILDQPNLSTHLVSLSMLVNRFGAALGLLLIGYLIDTGISVRILAITYAVFTAILGLCYAGTARLPALGPKLLAPFIRHYYKLDVERRMPADVKPDSKHPQMDIALIFTVAVLGFLLPSLLAAAVPDYRATLLQSGFIVNSFATLYSALKIEKGLALTLHTGTETEKWIAYVNFMHARSIGSIVASGLLVSILFFV